MRKVIGIGESVLDIVLKNNQPKSANPGGSAFNAVISLGRCGLPSCFLTEMGDDYVADLTIGFMEQSGVATHFVTQIPNTKSKVSLAFLNDKNEASYQFYRDPEPENLVYAVPPINPDDLVLISSFYAVNPSIRYRVQPFLKKAYDAGAIIYYDVNFRMNHASSIPAVMASVRENFSLSSIVRGSVDDFKVLYGTTDAQEIYEKYVAPYCPILILTNGANPVRIYTPTLRLQFEVEQMETVSTIGAGDNYNAGVLYYLYKNKIGKADLQKLQSEQWHELQKEAESFATHVCQSIENYVSVEFGKKKAPTR